MRSIARAIPAGPGVTVALAAVAVASRVPFASEMLFSYDSANYAFAIRDYYHVGHHHPHPPGYPLYVAAGWAMTQILGEPNRGLVAVSILASVLAVVATHRLGVAQFGATTGLVATLVLLFSTGFWGYGEVAYPYTALAGFGAAIAYVSFRLQTERDRLAAISGALFGIAAGFRWDLVLELGLLWLFGLLRCSWPARALAGGAFAAVSVAWAVPMVGLSGGLEEYLAALRAQSGYVVGAFSVAAGGETLARYNADLLLRYLRLALGAPLLLAVYALGRTLTPARLATDQRLRLLLLWLAPPLAVFLFLHIGDPGYVLVLVPGLCLLIAATLDDLASDLGTLAEVVATRASESIGRAARKICAAAPSLLVALLLAWNVHTFFNDPGPTRLWEIRHIDGLLATQVDYVRRSLDPASTLILAHDRFRQLQYYLTEYRVVLLFDEYQPGYRDSARTVALPEGVRTVVVADEEPVLGPVAVARSESIHLFDEPGGSIRLIDAADATALRVGYGEVEVVLK